jgi:hypothetical protein
MHLDLEADDPGWLVDAGFSYLLQQAGTFLETLLGIAALDFE